MTKITKDDMHGNKATMKIRFPFAITQVGSNVVEVALDGGISFPFLEPQGEIAERFDKAMGIDMSTHEEIIERLNVEYRRRLLVECIKVD